MESILKAKPGETVSPQHCSKEQYQAIFETSFTVLPDCKTIIGMDAETSKSLIMEDITNQDQSPTKFGERSDPINTILYLEASDVLMVAGDDWNVIQYKRDSKGAWVVDWDYGDIGIFQVTAGDKIGSLAIFGGEFSLTAIDTVSKKVIKSKYNTAINRIFSLQFCPVSQSKVTLFVGGKYPEYSEVTSDLLNVSELTNGFWVEFYIKSGKKNWEYSQNRKG